LVQSFAELKQGDEVITSALTKPEDGIIFSYCRHSGIRVSAFDHGVTLGLSRWSEYEASQAGMLFADRGFYHSRCAADVIGRFSPHQDRVVVGLPKIAERVRWRWIQRVLSRHIIGVSMKEHVVMFVPELDKNNFIYGPYHDNDLQYLIKTENTIIRLCELFPQSTVVVKLYPTQRYLDPCLFVDIIERHSNLKFCFDVDFRFVRSAADLIVTTATQSTLGWVAGSGVPAVALEFPWCPLRIRGPRLDISYSSLSVNAYFIQRSSVCSDTSCDVAQKICSNVSL